jgi:uncharacterized protein YuzE
MKIRYFPDTDTVYLELTDQQVVETIDLNENIVVDLDVNGNVVAITIEHAQERANIFEFSFQQVIARQPQHASFGS